MIHIVAFWFISGFQAKGHMIYLIGGKVGSEQSPGYYISGISMWAVVQNWEDLMREGLETTVANILNLNRL